MTRGVAQHQVGKAALRSNQVMDNAADLVAHFGMRPTPIPRRGVVLPGRDAASRMLRVSFHPEVERVVVSIWDHDICMATLRLAPEDVPDLVRGLTAALLPPAEPVPEAVPQPRSSRSPTVALATLPPPPAVTEIGLASA